MVLKEAYDKCKRIDPKIWIASYVVISALLLFLYPPMQVSHFEITNSTTNATLENQYRTTLAQILGGGAVAIGIYFGWKNYLTAQENLKTAQEGQITERFTRAIDQLGAKDKDGNPVIEIRLGGIYALERIANESDKDYWPIMEILTAYVRKNSCIDKNNRKRVGNKGQYEASVDIQTILTVIGKYEHSYNSELINSLDLHNTCLRGVGLRDGHLEGANLVDADLNYTFLRGVHLKGAYLVEATFIRSNLFEAHLEEAHLEMAHLGSADLEGSYLNGAYFEGVSFSDTKLENADFREADLRGAENLTVDQLSKAKTLYKAQLDEGLEAELRKKGFGRLLDDEPKEEP